MSWEELLDGYHEGLVASTELELALTREVSPEGQANLRAALALGDRLSRLLAPLGPTAGDAAALKERLDALPQPEPPAWLAAELGLPATEAPAEAPAAEAFFNGDADLADLEQAAAAAPDHEAESLEAASQLGRQLRDLLGGLPGPRPFDPDAEVRDHAADDDEVQPAPERVRRLARLLQGQRTDELVDEPPLRLHVEPGLFKGTPLEVLVRRALGDALASCRASEATLWLLSTDGERLRGVVNQVWDGSSRPELEAAEVPVSVSAIGQAVTKGRARRLGPTAYQDPVVSWTSGVEVHGMLAAPVRLGEAVVGVLSAVNPQGRELFAAEDLVGLVWQAHVLGLVLADCLTPAVQERPPWADDLEL
jgi:hypothetical protein